MRGEVSFIHNTMTFKTPLPTCKTLHLPICRNISNFIKDWQHLRQNSGRQHSCKRGKPSSMASLKASANQEGSQVPSWEQGIPGPYPFSRPSSKAQVGSWKPVTLPTLITSNRLTSLRSLLDTGTWQRHTCDNLSALHSFISGQQPPYPAVQVHGTHRRTSSTNHSTGLGHQGIRKAQFVSRVPDRPGVSTQESCMRPEMCH